MEKLALTAVVLILLMALHLTTASVQSCCNRCSRKNKACKPIGNTCRCVERDNVIAKQFPDASSRSADDIPEAEIRRRIHGHVLGNI
ncbi:hypothetical protein DPMN_084371 [Dreissena polymorpha]|uniref:Secreted protein n=1 Tax=Dreissena polymorpha TaxID=45954 RepID=A0A9D3YAM1_DREPO|nr:hypothetical protein DPMN_084371 [Dreissena polymorpha]